MTDDLREKAREIAMMLASGSDQSERVRRLQAQVMAQSIIHLISAAESATFERAAKLICGAQYGVPCRHSATDYYGCPAAAIWREREKK